MATSRQQNAGGPRDLVTRAHQMLIGVGAPYAPQEAMRLVREACAQKFGDALMYHAVLAARGHGRPQSFDDAMAYLAEAAAAGDTRAKSQVAALGGKFDPAAWFGPIAKTQHHDAPRIFTIENFLSKPVCDWLIKRSRKRLGPAVIHTAALGGALAASDHRSNSVAGSNALEPDLVLQLTNMRIAAAIGLPLVQQEATNFLHYTRGQEYTPHYDHVTPGEETQPVFARELASMGQRIATVLVYLNEGYEGGETEFPHLNWRYRGKTGDALVFWNLSEELAHEPNAWHAGMPVTKGEKWLLSKWVRQKPVPLI